MLAGRPAGLEVSGATRSRSPPPSPRRRRAARWPRRAEAVRLVWRTRTGRRDGHVWRTLAPPTGLVLGASRQPVRDRRRRGNRRGPVLAAGLSRRLCRDADGGDGPLATLLG